MVMARWDPFRELRRMQDMADRLSGDFGRSAALDIGAWAISTDVIEKKDNIVVRAAAPGINPEDIDVSIENNILTISVERRGETELGQEGRYLLRESSEGIFRRSLQLPNIVDADRAESYYENGVITLTFPKLEQAKARRIEVKAAGGQQQLDTGERRQEAA
jgi:HSP20 family protein